MKRVPKGPQKLRERKKNKLRKQKTKATKTKNYKVIESKKELPGPIVLSRGTVKRSEEIIPDVSNLEKLSGYLYKSGMFPQFKNAHQAITVIEYGRELGIQPVQALQTMCVINGKLCIESKALLALAIQKGIKHKVIKNDEKICQIEFKRDGFDPHIETFTFDDAKRVKTKDGKSLVEKDNYKNYPKQMNFWRCVANGIRTYCPDLALGLYSKEEIENAPTLEGQIVSGEIKEAEEVKETQARTEEDKEKQELVNNIKYKLLKFEIYPQLFKKFLEEFQASGTTKEPRVFVGYKFGNLSLHEGKLSDLKLLWQNFDYVINQFRQWLEEKKVSEEGEGEPLAEGLNVEAEGPELKEKQEL